jgi:putative transposase
MSSTQIWIHTVWVTKQRVPFFDKATLHQICVHLKQKALYLGIQLDYIYGYTNHVHVLLQLRGKQSIADINKQLKGESSRWINAKGLTKEYFQWQSGYYAVSVSPDVVPNVRTYIRNQWEKHQNINLEDELRRMVPEE